MSDNLLISHFLKFEFSTIDIVAYLDKASREYLINNVEEIIFDIRKKKGMDDFYEKLDQEVAAQKYFKIKTYRSVKEGMVKMPRPAQLVLLQKDLLALRPELIELKIVIDQVNRKSRYFNFNEFFYKNYNAVIESFEALDSCLEIFNYLIENRDLVEGCLSRQIPHGQSTKIIGKDSKLLLMYRFYKQDYSLNWDDFYQEFKIVHENLEFRFYAPVAFWQNCKVLQMHSVLASEWCSSWEFPLRGTIIIENYQSFLSLIPKVRHHLLVWGQGWKAAQIGVIRQSLPVPLYYWGDLDKEGIEILNVVSDQIKEVVCPLLMDMNTFINYKNLAQKLNRSCATKKQLKLLDDVYQQVCELDLRIEQEQVNWPESWDM